MAPTDTADERRLELTSPTALRARLLVAAAVAVALDRRSRVRWLVLGTSASRYWHGLISDHRSAAQPLRLVDAARLLPRAVRGDRPVS